MCNRYPYCLGWYTPLTRVYAAASIYLITCAQASHPTCQVVDDAGISSAHITFNQQQEWDSPELASLGWLQRSGIQCHWENKGYASFDDFLATLKNSRRKTIRQVGRQMSLS